MKTTIQKSIILMAGLFSAAFLNSACTDNPERSGQGDQQVEARIGEQAETERVTTNQAEPITMDQIQPNNSREPASTQPMAQQNPPLKIENYPFEKRSEFKADLEKRMSSFEKALTALKSTKTANQKLQKNAPDQASANPNAPRTEEIKKLEEHFKTARAKVEALDKAEQKNWEQVKTTVRDEVTTLESQFQKLSHPL